jgi:hypothetical protein
MLAALGQRVSRHQCSSNPRISQRHARFTLHRLAFYNSIMDGSSILPMSCCRQQAAGMKDPGCCRRSHSPAGANVRATVQDGRMVIQGHTLTSPQGWEAMKAALRAANVSRSSSSAAAAQRLQRPLCPSHSSSSCCCCSHSSIRQSDTHAVATLFAGEARQPAGGGVHAAAWHTCG